MANHAYVDEAKEQPAKGSSRSSVVAVHKGCTHAMHVPVRVVVNTVEDLHTHTTGAGVGTTYVEFSPTMQAMLAPCAKRRGMSSESHEGWAVSFQENRL